MRSLLDEWEVIDSNGLLLGYIIKELDGTYTVLVEGAAWDGFSTFTEAHDYIMRTER